MLQRQRLFDSLMWHAVLHTNLLGSFALLEAKYKLLHIISTCEDVRVLFLIPARTCNAMPWSKGSEALMKTGLGSCTRSSYYVVGIPM